MNFNKFLKIFIFSCFFSLISSININLKGAECFGAGIRSGAETSVNVLSNPVNQLVKKIKETQKLLGEKKRELEERGEKNAAIALILFGIIGALIGSAVLLNSYFHYQRRKKRRERKKEKDKFL